MKDFMKFLVRFIASAAIIFMAMSVPYFFKTDVNAIAKANESQSKTTTVTKETEMETTLDGDPVVRPEGIKMADSYSTWSLCGIVEDITVGEDMMIASAILGLISAILLSLKGNVGKYLSIYGIGYIATNIAAIAIAMFNNHFTQAYTHFYDKEFTQIAIPVLIGYIVICGLSAFVAAIVFEENKKNKKETKKEKDVTEENKTMKFLLKFISATAIIFFVATILYFLKTQDVCKNQINEITNNRVSATTQSMVVTNLEGDPIVDGKDIGMVDYYEYQAQSAISSQAMVMFSFLIFATIFGLIAAMIITIQEDIKNNDVKKASAKKTTKKTSSTAKKTTTKKADTKEIEK